MSAPARNGSGRVFRRFLCCRASGGPVRSYTGGMATGPKCGWKLEKTARRFGFVRIAGCDEVGRGPMFGPVVAAAVILPAGCRLEGLTDSKLLTEKKRNELDSEIRATALAFAIAAVDVETIDRINILRASLLAMRMAVEQLAPPPDYLLIDGRDKIDWPCPQQAVIQGDAKKSFDCCGERAGQGASRRAARGAGCGVSGIWAGAAQGVLLAGASGGSGSTGADSAASKELQSSGADDV